MFRHNLLMSNILLNSIKKEKTLDFWGEKLLHGREERGCLLNLGLGIFIL